MALEEPDGGVEVAAPGADSLADDEDARIARHLLAEALAGRLGERQLAHQRASPGSAYTCRVALAGSGHGLASANSAASFTSAATSWSMRSRSDGRGSARLEQPVPPARDRAALPPRVDLLARAVARVAHPLGVRSGAVGEAFEQRRPVAAPRPPHRLAGGFVDGEDVVAVQPDARQPVGRAPGRDVRIARHRLEGHLGRVEVVLADEQDRQAPDGGQVEALVERAVVDGAVAEERDAHAVGPEEAVAVAGPGGHQDAGPDDPARPQEADLGREEVHAAAPAARAAGGAPEQLGHELARRDALRQRVAVTAVGAEHRVVRPEVGGDAGRDRLLADVGVAGALDQAAGVGARQRLLGPPDHDHPPVERQGPLAREIRNRLAHCGHRGPFGRRRVTAPWARACCRPR